MILNVAFKNCNIMFPNGWHISTESILMYYKITWVFNEENCITMNKITCKVEWLND